MFLGAVLLSTPTVGCTKSAAANAIIATAATVVAAAALRAATNSCYATCGYGTVCNPDTGFCEAEPESGKTVCVDTPGQPPCTERRQPDSSLVAPEDVDGCGGVCLENEECVMRHGDLTCEPKHVSRK